METYYKNLTEAKKQIFNKGRVSVLMDFETMCKADAMVGFPKADWQAIKKFFAWNKSISNWHK